MSLISGAMLLVFIADLIVGRVSDGAVDIYSMLYFSRFHIFKGQVWRILTFIFLYPTSWNPLFILLAIYFYWWIGTTIERYMGTARFNLYYLFGIIGSIIAGLLVGGMTNEYLNLSLFLAFAVMFPDVRVMLFFIIPVKVKWLGLIDGALLIYSFIFGNAISRAAIIAAIINFLIFFGPHLIRVCQQTYREYQWKKGKRG